MKRASVYSSFLTERIDGLAYDSVTSVRTECVMAKRCVLEQKLRLLTAYRNRIREIDLANVTQWSTST